jgi:predicted ribosome quality control (RQC) complex YloA/Tae2 family protein
LKIKKFISTNGYDILAGQDDTSNDYLTFTLADQNDLWFHVSGFPGSHVVLKCGTSKPEKQDIKDAAGLAVYFSKMRDGGKVSVSYCEAKQVRKPKGAKPGSVNIKRPKTIKTGAKLLEERE